MLDLIFLPAKFQRVPQTEDCESLSREENKSELSQTPSRPTITKSHIYMCAFLLLAFPATALLGAYFGGHWFVNFTTKDCISQVSQFCMFTLASS
jgi:hypothetical protein